MKNSIQNKFWGAAKSIAAVAVLGISVANLSADTLTITWTGTIGELEDAIMNDNYAHDVYLLEANKVYLQREIIELESSCHIVGAAYGDGEHPATIQPILGSDGISQFSGWPATNIKTYGEDQSYEFKNLLFNGAFDDGSTTLFGVLSTYGARNSILVDHVTSVHNEVITYFCFGQEEHWTLTNNTAVQYSSYPAGMFFGGFWWGGGSWTGTVESLLIQNNTIEGTHGQTIVIYDNGLVNRTYYERINIDHNTFVNSILETKYYRHGNNTHFTNNLFINQMSGGQTRNAYNTNIALNNDLENGHGKTVTLYQGACSDSTLLADGNCWDNTNRNIHYNNNAWFDTPELLDMFAMDPWCWDLPADSNGVVVTLCDTMIAGQSKWLGDSTIAQFVNNVSESNNIHAADLGWNLDPAYTNFQIARTEDWLDNGVHDSHTDRFWMHQADGDPISVQWPLPLDFSYSASSGAATHCTHGGPLGSTHHMAHTGDIALDNPDPIQGVFISEAAEGNSNNKYIEIYNGTADTVDLAGFAYPTVSNAPTEEGNHEYWNSFEAGAIIAPGGVYVIAHPSADSAGILPYANETYNYLSNGDDGFCFVQGSEDDYIIVDCVGDFYGDPGSGWDVAGVVNATKDHTLVRKFGINNGNPDWNVSAGTDAENSEWVVLEQNDWSNLGFHNEQGPTMVTFWLDAEDVPCEGSPYLAGWFNDWNATDIEMTYDEDWDEYWADVALMPGYYEYKFVCYDWSGSEDVPAECGNPNDDGDINRYIEVPELEEGDWYETDVVAWGECPDPDPCDLLDCSNLQFVGVMDSDLVYEIADTLGFTADSIMSLISMGEVSMGLFSSWGGDTATYMPEFSSAEDTTFIYLAEYPDGIPDTTVYYFWWYSVPAYGIWNFEYDDLQEYGLGEECAFAYEDYDEYYDTTSVYNARYWDPSLWEEELYMLAMGDDDVDPYDVWNVDLYGSCDFWFDGGGDDMDGVYLGSFQGHDYYQVNDFVYWDEAHDIATDAGGYLATITSPEENNFLYNSIDWDVYGEFYMGLYDATMDNNGWTWVTGEPLGFQNWDEGQPDCPGCQNYGVIWEHEGKWDDGDGDMPFIVEFGDVEEPEEPVLTNYSAAVINSNSFYDGDSIGTLPDLEIHDGVHFRATFDTTGAGPYVGMAAIHYDSNFNGVLDSNDQNILNSPLVDSYYNYGNYSDDVLLLEDNGPNDYNDEPGVFETDIFAQDYGNEFLRVQGATYFFSVLDTNYSIVGITVVSPYSDSEQRYTGHALMAADTTEGVQGLYFTVVNWTDENRHGISGADGYYDIGVNVGDSSGSYIHGRDWNEDDGRTMPIFWHPSPYDYYEGGGIWTWYSYYPYGIPAEGIYIKTRVLELNTMISGQVLDPDLNPVETWVEMQTEVGIDTSTFWMNYYTDSDSSGYYSGWGMNGYDVNIQSGAEGVEYYDSTLFVFTDQYDEQLDAYLFNHDIELQPIDPGPPVNLVHNGGFEDYMGWWELNPYDAGNYAFDSTGSYVYLSEETITAFEGDRVLKMWGGYHSDGYNWTDVSQAHYDYINPYDGAVITASAMMMSHPDDWIGDTSGSAAMNKAHAFISYWDWDGYYMYTDWSDPFDASFSAGDWHQIEVTATVPEGAYTVRVGVGFDQIDWSHGSVYIDDVQSTVGMTFVSTGFIEGYVNGEMYNDEFDYWYMEGIANVPVEVYSENNYYQVFTNEDGYYSVNVPANDMYYVTTPADLPGLYNSDMHSFYVYPYDYYWASFDFYSITNQWFNVQGHVTDADNNPMYDVQVELISSSTDSNGWSDYAYTDMDGYYDLEVPYGVYDFNAYAPGHLTNWVYGVEVFDYTTLDFTLEMIDEFDGAVSGVINFYGEMPEGEAYVWVHTDVYQTYTYANEDGFFYVDLVNGVYDIYIGAPGYNSFYMEDAFEVSGNTATFNVDMYEYGYASAPTIVDLHDVANDQGRQLRTVWETGIAGDWEYFTQFSIWRKVNGAPIELWDYVETVPWHGDSDPYAAVVPTLGDSSMYGDYESTFMITAHTEDVNFYLDSDPVSGSSIDNLHPDVPMNFMVNQGGGGAVSLSWSASEDVDFDFYNVYRQEIVSTEPAVVFTTVDSFFVDQNAAEAGAYEYWITAVDMSGLESDPSNSVSAVLSADESLGLPTEFALRQNYPNPFNPSTQIRYALPEETRVTISIYDLMGRKVRTLVNDVQSAGYRTAMWNATNDMGRPVSAGVYIYSIHAGDFIQNRKMVLMK